MKKVISVFCAAALASSVISGAAADDVRVELDGKTLAFDVPPQIIDGRTLVPLRVIFEALGASVDWISETRTVTAQKDGINISMTIGSNAMRINSETVELDVPPQIIDDRTLVPARAVAEGFGAKVDWNGDTRTVIISTVTSSQAAPTPAPSPTPAPAAVFPIVYDEASDLSSETVSNFRLVNVAATETGEFVVDYVVETFLESTGKAAVKFICLDENGKRVDVWERLYDSTAYTPTQHEDRVTVSGRTKTIVCDTK